MNRVPPTRMLSSSMGFSKRVVPWLLAVLLAVCAGLPLIGVPWNDALFVAGLCGFGLLGLRFSASQVADVVLDGGDFLRIRDGKIEEDIPLHEIERVNEPLRGRQGPRIELVLTAPGRLGRVIAFIPTVHSLVPFQKSALTLELEERIERARREHRATPPNPLRSSGEHSVIR